MGGLGVLAAMKCSMLWLRRHCGLAGPCCCCSGAAGSLNASASSRCSTSGTSGAAATAGMGCCCRGFSTSHRPLVVWMVAPVVMPTAEPGSRWGAGGFGMGQGRSEEGCLLGVCTERLESTAGHAACSTSLQNAIGSSEQPKQPSNTAAQQGTHQAACRARAQSRSGAQSWPRPSPPPAAQTGRLRRSNKTGMAQLQ